MAREVSSITRVGKGEPFELQVSRDQISLHKTIFKFGSNTVVGASKETIWEQGGLYAYPASATFKTVANCNGRF